MKNAVIKIEHLYLAFVFWLQQKNVNNAAERFLLSF